MGVRSVEEYNVRTLQKTNTGTYTLSIPVQYVRELRWQQRQKVVVSLRGNKLVIEDWKPGQ